MAAPRGFRTIDYGDGVHGLLLVGPGYTWARVAEHFAKKLRLSKKVKLDPEGGMFVARSSDTAALEALRAKLEPLLADAAKFKKLVATLKKD